MKLAVSACLLGYNCKYNGKNNAHPAVMELGKKHTLIPVCPEMMGGLSCPRCPAEIQGNRIITRNGQDVTAEFKKGAEDAMALCREEQVDAVILQPRSPSCGVYRIYDGTFSGTLKEGSGLFAQELVKEGVPLIEADASLSCQQLENDLKLSC